MTFSELQKINTKIRLLSKELKSSDKTNEEKEKINILLMEYYKNFH